MSDNPTSVKHQHKSATDYSSAEVTRRQRQSRRRAVQILFAIALGAYVSMAVLAHYYAYFDWDLRLARMIQSVGTPGMKPLMLFVSALGRGWLEFAIVLAAGIALIAARLRTEGLICLVGVGLGRLVSSLLKLLSGRPRPTNELVQIGGGFSESSFPSGHALFFMTFFGFLFFLTYLLAKPGLARSSVLVVLAALIGLVGVSRVYLGAHWPSDVVGGYLAGGLWLMLMIWTYRRARS